ncbi:hypothetical protein HHI36_014252 [Cryptolaemus montrouzieri]|uniref:Uncharacterized protein n=1 Tax=Cryptolaemus montrouzieri TaxID=559131 RepID=A0ABD2N2M5_9CUCU
MLDDHTEIFKNCFASSTWNCDRVKKWISNKHLHIKVIHCVTCMENDCNRNTYEAPLSSASINKIEYSFIMIPIFIPLLK